MSSAFDQPFWDDLYSASDRIWSGRPNPHLVTEATGITPGRALDIGSGEGGDAVWLASEGWSVTAVDLSEVALGRARAHAQDPAQTDPTTAARITWEHRDVLAWAPEPSSFDLVSSQYSHFPTADMHALVERLAAAVAPGGHLLVVGHEDHGHRHSSASAEHEHADEVGEHEAGEHEAGHDEPEQRAVMDAGFFYTPDELRGLLDPALWEVQVADYRQHPSREGRDTVLHARRR
jgi:SAM-dependent methyltransferase